MRWGGRENAAAAQRCGRISALDKGTARRDLVFEGSPTLFYAEAGGPNLLLARIRGRRETRDKRASLPSLQGSTASGRGHGYHATSCTKDLLNISKKRQKLL